MICESIAVGPFDCNCIIIGDEDSHEALVVDPGGDVNRIMEHVLRHGLIVRMAIHTHAHVDHVGGTRELNAATGARIMLHPGDRMLYEDLPLQAQMLGLQSEPTVPVDEWLTDGERLLIGRHSFDVLHTPGHSPGSVCFFFAEESLLVAGDTLFAGSVGRTDLWGGSTTDLLKSIREKLLCLDDGVRVFPGHGPATTIGRERVKNPFVR